MRDLRHSQRKQSGSVLLIVATILIPIFLGSAMLAIDLSRLVLIRGELQNAADAAALVGAASITKGKIANNVNIDANTYVQKNIVGGTNPGYIVTPRAGCVNLVTREWVNTPLTSKVTCTTPNTLGGIRLTIRNQTTVLGFAKFFNITIPALRVSAAAVVLPVGSTKQIDLLY